MKTLIAIAAFALTMSLASASFASESYNVFGVTLPITAEEVTNDTIGVYVEEDSNSYNVFGVQLPMSPKSSEAAASLGANEKVEDVDYTPDYTIVFGVKLPSTPRS